MDIKKLGDTLHQGYPRDSGDKRMYNPERDIAYLAPALMQLTTNSFYESGSAHGEFQSLTDEEQEQFSQLAIAIGDFCKHFMRGDRTFSQAMSEAGLNKFPHKLVYLWLAHFGHTVMSAFYYGCRDVMIKGVNEDPMPYDKIFDSAEELRGFLWRTANE